MKFQFMVNGSVDLVLVPENDLEKSLLKSLTTQENQFKQVTKGTSVGAQFNDGTIIITAVHAGQIKEVQQV